ncbi:hypothetical protein HHI36_006825 [Cryptolaemus montrouzieri]|uniref:PLAT domain-containing protein n=1 Tax=Cryptolaemus montrouzieri TaxID=559131 RepID=A0ABD2MMQ2_9CUCU
MSTTPQAIDCACQHLSILAGSFDYNDLKEHPKFIKIDFVLHETGSIHICVTVCIVFGIYFFLLVYSVQKNETVEDEVLFVADVPAENRFGYLVEIVTGGRIDAGTTSDVVIQLFGKNGRSQEHVLNFPDPFLELLQRKQTDLFVLATPMHLGKLIKIYVWFDCSGISPTWYCEKIRICDLQTKEWYLFKVKKWFRVDGKPRLFLSVATSIDKESKKERMNKKKLLLQRFLNFGRINNTIWRLSTNAVNPNFGYPKRLTLILSVLLTLMMVSMHFYGIPEFLPRDFITPNCYFVWEMKILYIGIWSGLLTILPHLAIMEGFMNARLQFQSKTARDVKPLPTAFTVIFWVILIANILIVTHILLIYGYRVIAPTTWQWTVSTLIAFAIYIFILDYIYNIFLILVRKVVKTSRLNFEKILKNVEIQRKYLYTVFGRYIYRPILSPMYEKLTRNDYMRKRIHFKQKREVVWQIQDLFMLVAFMSFFYFIVISEKDSIYDILGHNQAFSLIVGFPSTKNKLNDVTQMDEFEDYMEFTFIPSIQSYQWYGRYVSESPGMTSDAHNKYLAVARMRQHRADEYNCNVTKIMKFVNRTCKSSSYFFHYDYLNYTVGWNTTIAEFHISRLGHVWGYQESIGEPHFGIAGFYRSGGYTAQLGRTLHNSYVNFEYLKRYIWMDQFTRAILIEFVLYNVNTNLFNFALVVLERTPTGYIHKEVLVKTQRIIKHSTRTNAITFISGISFTFIVLILSVRTVLRIIKTKTWYARDIWHVVDLSLIVISVVWIILYFKKLQLMQYFAKELQEKQSKEFIDYFGMVRTEAWLNILAGFLICVTTIRLWKLLRFAKIFRMVERTFVYSFSSLVYMFIYYTICCIAFGIAVFVFLGTKTIHFKDSYTIMKTFLLITIGGMKASDLNIDQNQHGLGYVFYTVFNIFTLFIKTIFIAIIIVNYLKAQEFSFEEKLDYTMKDYVIERYGILKRLVYIWVRKFRLKAGGAKNDKEELVTPKSNDVRYMNCVKTYSNRMKAMACVAKCVLLRRLKGQMMDESDHALMMRTVKNLCNKKQGDAELFFTHGTKEEGYSLVEDRRIRLVETVVKRMLESPEERATRLKKEQVEEAFHANNLARLKKMNFQLNVISQAVKNIEINIPSD